MPPGIPGLLVLSIISSDARATVQIHIPCDPPVLRHNLTLVPGYPAFERARVGLQGVSTLGPGEVLISSLVLESLGLVAGAQHVGGWVLDRPPCTASAAKASAVSERASGISGQDVTPSTEDLYTSSAAVCKPKVCFHQS